jgi:CRP-like cAMP-binding protein
MSEPFIHYRLVQHARESVAYDLWQLPIFGGVSRDRRHRVRRSLEVVDLSAGQRLYPAGRRTREVALVLTGSAATAPPVFAFGRGDIIGLAHTLRDVPIPWDVYAVSDLRVAVIERRRLLALLDEVPSVAAWVARALASDALQHPDRKVTG